MEALAYWKAVTADKTGFLERVIAVLAESSVRYCVIGGQAVNAFVEPVVSLDLDLAVATTDLPSAEDLLRQHFRSSGSRTASKSPRPGRTCASSCRPTRGTERSSRGLPSETSWD